MDFEQEIIQLKEIIKTQEKTIKALLVAIKSIEQETGDEHMPTGEYFGFTFE